MYYAPTGQSRPADTGIYKLSYVGTVHSRVSLSFPIDGLIPFNANPIQPQLPHVPLADVLR